ncbi:MAG: hypothetical protein ACREUH_00195 [Burkholderiales bacterium]
MFFDCPGQETSLAPGDFIVFGELRGDDWEKLVAYMQGALQRATSTMNSALEMA